MHAYNTNLQRVYLVFCVVLAIVLLLRVIFVRRANRRELDKRIVVFLGALGGIKLSLGLITLVIAPDASFVIAGCMTGGLVLLTSALLLFRSMHQEKYFQKLYGFDPTRCGRCGYDLTGNVSGVCPECGWNLPDRKNG